MACSEDLACKGIQRFFDDSQNEYVYRILETTGPALEAGNDYTTYIKRTWTANERIIQPDVLIMSSFDLDTVIPFSLGCSKIISLAAIFNDS